MFLSAIGIKVQCVNIVFLKDGKMKLVIYLNFSMEYGVWNSSRDYLEIQKQCNNERECSSVFVKLIKLLLR